MCTCLNQVQFITICQTFISLSLSSRKFRCFVAEVVPANQICWQIFFLLYPKTTKFIAKTQWNSCLKLYLFFLQLRFFQLIIWSVYLLLLCDFIFRTFLLFSVWTGFFFTVPSVLYMTSSFIWNRIELLFYNIK